MALNDVSLTAGMRSNLLSLQNTVKLLDRTQERLSTGKKVNTAIDNPVSFFAAQSLNSRASIIDSLKDAMGQAVQTITAADKGIKAITAMIEQAKGIAQSALSAELTAGVATGALALVGIEEADEIEIGGVAFTATADAPAAGEFHASATNDLITMMSLADAINAHDWGAGNVSYKASVSNGVLNIQKFDTDGQMTALANGDFDSTIANGSATLTIVPGGTELQSLQDQYNEMRAQMTAVANDSGYKGKNLLSAVPDLNTLDVQFEGYKLTVQGFDASATEAGLGITEATWATDLSYASIGADITRLDNALNTLRQNASQLAGNLSIITVRQDFSTNMINTLIEGADKLTLADANEEGANMLMLQTRQSLSTTALSLSAQAAQSVLRLFQ